MASGTMMNMLDMYFPFVAPHLKTMNATTTQNTLYPGIDFSQRSWLEQQWAAYYIWMGNPILATGLLSFLVHEVSWLLSERRLRLTACPGRLLWPSIAMVDHRFHTLLPPVEAATRKSTSSAYEGHSLINVSQGKIPTNEQYWACIKLVVITHFTCEFPLIYVFHPICCYFGMSTYEVPFSSLPLMACQIASFFVFEDFFHYWAHRALHWGPLYKNIHKLHHRHQAPFGMAAEYAHPLEVLILAQGTITGPFLYCLVRQDLHISTVYIWITLRLFQAIDAHSGYDFPWSLRHFIPFWAGADHHDFHHQAFVNCFSTSFRWWDYMFGTDNKYHAYRARVAAAKPSQRNGVIAQEMDAIEKEGIRAERLAAAGEGRGGMEGVPKGKLE